VAKQHNAGTAGDSWLEDGPAVLARSRSIADDRPGEALPAAGGGVRRSTASAVTTVKPQIAVYAPSIKLGYRDLLAVDAFSKLISRFDVVWLFARQMPAVGIPEHAPVKIMHFRPIRYLLWLGLHSLVRFEYDKSIFGGQQKKPTLGLSRTYRRVLSAIISLRLSWPVRRVLKFGLDTTAPNLSRTLQGCRALLCFGSAKDPLFDSLVRSSRKLGIPVILVTLNWDNATAKPYIERPELILTWGRQTAELSASIHGIRSIPVGSPRFDFYSKLPPVDTPAAKQQLGLRPDLTYVLFAGAGFPFMEIETLRMMAHALAQHGRTDIRIIYRPHPYSWSKFSKASLDPDLAEAVIFDPASELFDQNDMRQYAYLYPAVSALVTPFSTMAVEAASRGIPTLCIAFDHASHDVFDWKLNVQHQPHLKIFYEDVWPLLCLDIDQFEAAFLKLLDSIGDEKVSASAFRIFRRIVHLDDKEYMDRICDTVEAELNRAG
jgi:hypothetical protein